MSKHKDNNKAYMDGFKNNGNKVGLAIVFLDTIRRGKLPHIQLE